ncbi:hypothetical protein WN51_10434 [Melipona quadrifasciata]|uniref:Uncharacterized protein n=1 Tax=Melipona quadrifasciata TaxID=166423 RepID=A0A0M9A4F7_9HYME|nr:hypothetical protein WN51_10434 [Melipona quadrifasciata]
MGNLWHILERSDTIEEYVPDEQSTISKHYWKQNGLTDLDEQTSRLTLLLKLYSLLSHAVGLLLADNHRRVRSVAHIMGHHGNRCMLAILASLSIPPVNKVRRAVGEGLGGNEREKKTKLERQVVKCHEEEDGENEDDEEEEDDDEEEERRGIWWPKCIADLKNCITLLMTKLNITKLRITRITDDQSIKFPSETLK